MCCVLCVAFFFVFNSLSLLFLLLLLSYISSVHFFSPSLSIHLSFGPMFERRFVVARLFLSFVILLLYISHSRFVYTEARTQAYTLVVSIRSFDALVVVASQWLFDTLASFVRSFVYSICFCVFLFHFGFGCVNVCYRCGIVHVCACVFLSIFRWNCVPFFHFNSHQKRNHMHKLGFNQIDWFVYDSFFFSLFYSVLCLYL